MASVIDILQTNCEDLFGDVNVRSMFKRQSKLLSGDDFRNYPSTILISSARITVGVNLADKISWGSYSRLLVGDQSVPQDGPFFDWGFLEEPPE